MRFSGLPLLGHVPAGCCRRVVHHSLDQFGHCFPGDVGTHQLVKAIGLDGFREGMRHYFRTHAYGNATLSQFLGSLEKGSGVDLKEWARLWLETPSLNTIGARWEADGDRISQFSLGQTASRIGLLYTHEHRSFLGCWLPRYSSGCRAQ